MVISDWLWTNCNVCIRCVSKVLISTTTATTAQSVMLITVIKPLDSLTSYWLIIQRCSHGFSLLFLLRFEAICGFVLSTRLFRIIIFTCLLIQLHAYLWIICFRRTQNRLRLRARTQDGLHCWSHSQPDICDILVSLFPSDIMYLLNLRLINYDLSTFVV